MKITVVGVRAELVAWYERRGYRRNGESEVLSLIHQRADPDGAELVLEGLEKALDWAQADPLRPGGKEDLSMGGDAVG